MPSINLKKKLYDELIRMGIEPVELINELVKKYLEENDTRKASR